MPNTSRPMDRWIAVLDAFASQDDWGVRDLAAATGMSSTAAHRILHEMVRTDLLAEGIIGGRFTIGPELARISVLIAEGLDVRRIARPILEATAAQIGETVILTAYAQARQAFWAVDAVESDHPIQYIWKALRDWNDLTRGASGKGILAFLPDDDREAILATVPDSSRVALRESLREARDRGFVISHGERFSGAVGVSAPIHGASGRVIGDLLSGWPDNRTDPAKEERIALALVEASGRISRLLGYKGTGRAPTMPTTLRSAPK